MESEIDRIARNLEDDIIHVEDARFLLTQLREAHRKMTLAGEMATIIYRSQVLRNSIIPIKGNLTALLALLLDRPLSRKKHAPLCPANHYCFSRVPTGPCNCGGEQSSEFSYCKCGASLTTSAERYIGSCEICTAK